MASYQDEIWAAVPDERSLDRAALAWALETVGAGKPMRVLDLGCGDGRFAAALARSGARVTGVDSSGVALERARQEHPQLELVAPEGDGSLPFEDACFDAVTCMHVLQHVHDTQRLMSEVRRVLAPGGRLALAVPYHGRVKSLIVALASFERHFDPLEPALRFYTPRSLRRLLDDFGFEQAELRAAGGLPLLRETLLARATRAAIGVA